MIKVILGITTEKESFETKKLRDSKFHDLCITTIETKFSVHFMEK